MAMPLLGGRVYVREAEPTAADVDGIVYVTADHSLGEVTFKSAVDSAALLDNAFFSQVSVLSVPLPCKRLIFSPVSTQEYDDVRCFSEAAAGGMKRALNAGVKSPLLVLPSSQQYPQAQLVTLLGALQALYVPIQVREDAPTRAAAITLSVCSETANDISDTVKLATILEQGRVVARDIGGGDPERMAPPRVQQYVQAAFADLPNISIEVIDDPDVLAKEYPLFAAVDRAASVIERHRGRVMYLRYSPAGPVERTMYLVGKGITYDTGGADVKTDRSMYGMSRDKCGAAAVAGFMKVVGLLAPAGVRVVGALCVARNSIGENSYVADEVLTARSGIRVRVNNTDAEGRMVMADVLCKLKEEALTAVNPELLTVATLTGHAVISVGPYSIAVSNRCAREAGVAVALQTSGDIYGDLFELSTLRRDDFQAHASGLWAYDDVIQTAGGNKGPSTRCPRGHQAPAAFLNLTSGIVKHGVGSDKPLKYTHLDIAGSAGDPPCEPTGAPIIALYGAYLAPK